MGLWRTPIAFQSHHPKILLIPIPSFYVCGSKQGVCNCSDGIIQKLLSIIPAVIFAESKHSGMPPPG